MSASVLEKDKDLQKRGEALQKYDEASAHENLGARIKDIIESKMEPEAFGAWIKPLSVSARSDKIIIGAESRFAADFIRATYGGILSEVSNETGMKIELAFSPARGRADVANINKTLRVIQSPELPACAFSDFICGEANRFALHAVKKCASAPMPFSPLVICGPNGSGKTMLLESLAKNARMRAIMTSGGEFVSDFVRAMRTNEIFAFKDMMRGTDMFIMDDVQHLAGKRATAEEFLSLLSDLIRMKKNVVLTSEITPSQIAGFDRNLVSLLSSGLSVDIVPPDAEAREKILANSGVDPSAAKSIAARCPANGHILSGICKKIAAWKELDIGELNEGVLEKLLSDVLVKRNTPLMAVKNMCVKLGVSFDSLNSEIRTRPLVLARQKIMAALKMSTDLTLSEIGRLVGGRNHASVLYALNQIEKAKETDMLLAAELADLAN
ncbi:MAG: AAA family ATPase [Rickettsiales bacterium]|jgi:chromosomal replication initiator protein|nr:AAA family ATPase [Rickettsiales bacterium]